VSEVRPRDESCWNVPRRYREGKKKKKKSGLLLSSGPRCARASASSSSLLCSLHFFFFLKKIWQKITSKENSQHPLPCDGAGGHLEPPPSTQRTSLGPPWEPPDPSRSPSAARSSKSRRPHAACPLKGQRSHHTASGRDGSCFLVSRFLVLFLTSHVTAIGAEPAMGQSDSGMCVVPFFFLRRERSPHRHVSWPSTCVIPIICGKGPAKVTL
jgi:hypothetical protein